MYEKGSVFVFEFENIPDIEKIREIENNGIGIRRGEGFGQIVFTDKLPANAVKIESEVKQENTKGCTDISEEEKEILKLLAVKYYRLLIKKAAEKKALENMGKFRKVRQELYYLCFLH